MSHLAQKIDPCACQRLDAFECYALRNPEEAARTPAAHCRCQCHSEAATDQFDYESMHSAVLAIDESIRRRS